MKETDVRKAIAQAETFALGRLLEMDYGRVVLDFRVHQGHVRLLMSHEVSFKEDDGD